MSLAQPHTSSPYPNPISILSSLFQDQMTLDKVPPYSHTTRLNTENIDVDLRQRHTETLDCVLNIAKANQFAVIEAHSKVVSLYNNFNGNLVEVSERSERALRKTRNIQATNSLSHLLRSAQSLVQDAVPLAMHHIMDKNALVTSCADMTLNVWNLDDTSSKKRYKLRNKWPVNHSSQMSLCWVQAHQLLYSGSTEGRISAWSLDGDGVEKAVFEGHSDIVMKMETLPQLNNIVSASLDTTVRIWDTYTEKEVSE